MESERDLIWRPIRSSKNREKTEAGAVGADQGSEIQRREGMEREINGERDQRTQYRGKRAVKHPGKDGCINCHN